MKMVMVAPTSIDYVDDASGTKDVQRKAIRVHGEGRQYADEPCEHAGADDGAGRGTAEKDIGDGLPRFSQNWRA